MKNAQYDAIIVLGGSLNIDGSPVDADKVRLEKVAELYQSGITGVIIVCGSHGYKSREKSALTEARAYANYLKSLHIQQDAIYLEEESQETLGNLLFTKMHILMVHNWHKLLVIPTYNHSTERIEYLLTKILGSEYSWNILRVGENNDHTNKQREALALRHTKEINDQSSDGDHEAIYRGLMETHPAYGGTKWTIDGLREEMKH